MGAAVWMMQGTAEAHRFGQPLIPRWHLRPMALSLHQVAPFPSAGSVVRPGRGPRDAVPAGEKMQGSEAEWETETGVPGLQSKGGCGG